MLGQLRADAVWWLTNSGQSRRLQIEAWELLVPPTKIQDIDITSGIVVGASLILGFEKIFLHQPKFPEQDCHFIYKTSQDICGLGLNRTAAVFC